MEVKEIVDTFNDAMSDIRHGYWTFDGGQDRDRQILSEGIVKMEKIMDPLWEIIKKHQSTSAPSKS